MAQLFPSSLNRAMAQGFLENEVVD